MTTNGIRTLDPPGSLARQAYVALRRAIQDRHLVQGELYSEGELAESLGISRTPVREALIELSREGLIEIVRQRGFRLRELGPIEQQEVFELRRVLETFVVRKLADTNDPDHVGVLRAILARQATHLDDANAFLAVDEEFHLTMPALAGLERTREMLAILRGAMWLIGSTALVVPERLPHILDEHSAVVDGIESGDPDSAEAAIRFHIATTSTAVEEAAVAS
jgi:DNA-binding GntR family transcriptional regulator